MPADPPRREQTTAPKKPVSRSPGQKTVTISLEGELLRQIDARCQELDDDRSTYFRKCARLELERYLLSAGRQPQRPVAARPPSRKEKRTRLRDIDTVSLAVFGVIPAGWPQTSDQARFPVRYVRVAKGRFPEGAFGLDVRGDSMNAAAPEPILDGETVVLVLPEQREPCHDDIVAALCDGQTTLKRLKCSPRKQCVLHAESNNPAFARDIVPAHDLTIQGVVIGKL